MFVYVFVILQIGRDRVLNPAIHPYFEESREDFLSESSSLMKRSRTHPFELFLTKVAIHLRNAIGSFKDEKSIVKEISDIFNFMKILQQGGVSKHCYYK